MSIVRRIKKIGKKQRKEFCKMRIFNKSVPLDDPIKKNKQPTFKGSNTKGQTAQSESRYLKIHVRFIYIYIYIYRFVEEIC